MPTATGLKLQQLTARRRHGRAVNAVAEYLRKTLSIPNIFIEPRRISGFRPDVLAVDRGGSGDLHSVEVRILSSAEDPRRGLGSDMRSIRQAIQRAKNHPYHFNYLALPAVKENFSQDPTLFAPDGIGRIGILLVEETDEETPRVSQLVRPERFRVGAEKILPIEKFLVKAKPDMEVRI